MTGVAGMSSIEFQPKQLQFLGSHADITIYGGAAGGGKTFAVVADPLKRWKNGEFTATIFRRTYQDIVRPGALWDESMKIYSLFQGNPNLSSHTWSFPSGMRVAFAGLQYEQDLMSWRGAQMPAIYFDQLETFTEYQFFYMMSRNRSVCGVKPFIRATCNPEPGWLADFLDWWIAEDGYADLERAGKMRYFVNVENVIHWADTPEELAKEYHDIPPKSVTFIPATIYDNKILMEKDPGYLANLQGLSLVDRERLLGDAERGGNWKIKPEAGKLFNRKWFTIVNDWDKNRSWSAVIRWDFAATEQSLTSSDPDYTAWCVMVRDKVSGDEIVLEAGQKRLSPTDVYNEFQERCRYWWQFFRDIGISLMVRWEIEPGSASTREARYLAGLVPFADARGIRSVGNKIVRAKPLASQAEHGYVSVLRGAWNEEWLNHMHSQPAEHDDMMDAASGAHDDLTREGARKSARSYGG